LPLDLTAFAPRRLLEHDLLAGGAVLSRPATTLFVDLAGFTDLTGRLGAFGSRGTEQLSGALRTFFAAVTDEVTARGGDPIGFGGDALTFVFDGPAAEALDQARAAAEAIQRLTEQLSGAPTIAGPVVLRTRIGIARGTVATAVARAAGRAVPVHVGPGLDRAEEAQAAAATGEVVVHPSASEEDPDDASHDVRRGEPTPHQLAELASPWVLDRLDADPVSHRQVSASFVRFPSLPSGGVDPTEVAALVEDVARLLALATAWEGEVVQVSGGDKGVVGLVVHGAPVAHADDPLRAAETMLRLREELPLVAAGVATGPVFTALLGSRTRVFPTHVGLSVTTAARLMQAAGPGQVLVDDATWSGASGTLEPRGDAEELRLKGHERPVEARALEGWRGADRAAGTGSFPPLVGRVAELAAIEALLDRAGRGEAGVLTLVGELGLGKTRLLQEAADRARTRGFTVLAAEVDGHAPGRGRAVWSSFLGDLDEDQLGDLAQPLRPLLGSGPAGLGADPELHAELAGAAVASLLAARATQAPLLVTLDDVDGLDDFSASALGALASAASGRVGLLLSRARGDGPGESVSLGELTAREAGQVATDAWRLAGGGTAPAWLGPLVAERAGTHPLVVRTVTESLRETWQPGTPPPMFGTVGDDQQTLTGLLRERVDRLSRRDHDVLAALSVLGTASDAETVSSVLIDLPGAEVRDALAALAADRLVEVVTTADGERYRVRHRLLRDVIHSSLSHADRDRAHRAVVETLAARDADPVEIAEHVCHLDDPELVRRWYPAAAESARRAGSFPQAAGYLDAVRPLVTGDERAGLDVELLEVLLIAGRAPDVLALADKTQASDDSTLRVRRLLAVTVASFTSGDLERTQETGREVMALTQDGDEARYQRAAELVAIALSASGRIEEALEVARSSVDRAEASGDTRSAATSHAALGAVLLNADRAAEAEPHFHAALAAARELGDAVTQVHVLSDLAGCAYERGAHDECVELLGQARTVADRVGYRRHLTVSLTNEAFLRDAVGDHRAAACAEVAVRRCLELGEPTTALSALDAWLSGEPDLASEPDWWRRLAQLDRALHQPQVAAEHAAEQAVAAARRGAVDEARAAADEAATSEDPAVVRRAVLARAMVAGTDADVLAGLDQAEDDADPRERAEIALERWRVTRAEDARAAALGLLGTAYAEQPTRLLRSWYDELGADPPDPPQPLPPPVGIAETAQAGGAAELEAALTAVEAAVAARQRSEKNTER